MRHPEPVDVPDAAQTVVARVHMVHLCPGLRVGAQQVGHRGGGGDVVIGGMQHRDRRGHLVVEVFLRLAFDRIGGVAAGSAPLPPLHTDPGRQVLARRHAHQERDEAAGDQPDDEVTLDSICDELIIYGSPDKVADEIIKFRERVGDFGTLLYAGKDWRDPTLAKRSMQLLAEKVMPKVNAVPPPKAKVA